MGQAPTDPVVGKVLDDLDFEPTDQVLTDYYEGLGLARPTGATVPPMVAGEVDNDFHPQTAFHQDRGHLWMRQQWALRAPLQVGHRYIANGIIEDIYRRRDRTVVNTAMTLTDRDGQIMATSNHHQSFLLDEPIDQVAFREPTAKEGARRFTVPDGTPIEPYDTTVTLEMCGQFFHGSRNYHTDRAASEALGFAEVVVGGRMTMAYVGHVLENHFGEPWWTSGRLDLKFTNPVWPDDHLTVKGVEVGPSPDEPSSRRAFVWIEKDDGTIALVVDADCAKG